VVRTCTHAPPQFTGLHPKLIPPAAILEAELSASIEAKVRDAIVERVLREANVDAQVAAALADIEKPGGDVLVDGITELFEHEPDRQWRDHIEAVAIECASMATPPAHRAAADDDDAEGAPP
jgi:hypothetical protein